MLGWKTMDEWRANGPANGVRMVLLLSDGDRVIGHYTGESASWTWDGMGRTNAVPVAWTDLPSVPDELRDRNVHILHARGDLADLERSPLILKFDQ